MVKIFVGNLDELASAANLQKLFEEFGAVEECDVLTKFGFVHMPKMEDAKAAIAALHRTEFEGTTMNVEISTGGDRKSGGGGDRGRGGRGGRGGYGREMNGFGPRRGGYGDRYDPYARPMRRPDPYDRYDDPYARDPYGRDPYARDPYARDPYARDPYARDPYARDPYARDPYARADPYDRPPIDYYARSSRGRPY